MESETERGRSMGERLIEAGMKLHSELSLEALLRSVVELAVDISDATYGALGVIGPDGRISDFITHGISEEEEAAIGPRPTGHGILGILISEGRPLRIPRMDSDPRSSGFPANHPPMTSFLGAPIVALGRVFGDLYLTDKRGADEFDEEDENAIVMLAAQAGLAIQNSRLYEESQRIQEEMRRLEVMEDRERIAKELHDGVIQSLFAVGMGLQGTASIARDPDLTERIQSAVDEIDRAIRDLRDYVFGLRPGILADRELAQALQELGQEMGAKYDVVTIVDVDRHVAAGLGSKANDVIQMSREALSNVGRHAGAATCRLSLYESQGKAVLEIDDDGQGFDTSQPESGMGLGNLSDRAKALGGEVAIASSAAEGTTVRITLPL